MVEEVKAYDIEGWNKSIASLFGKTPKISIICGKCRCLFKKRFEIAECNNRNPRALCPHCGVVNSVPLLMDDGTI